MNKLATTIAVASLTLATFGGAAIAQNANQDDFTKADGNKDGMVSMTEAVGVYPTLTQDLFNQADKNADGNLDQGEFTALQGLSAGLGNDSTASGGMGSSSDGGPTNGGNSSEAPNGSSSDGGPTNGGGSSSSAM
jgi:hypothetical protein